MTTDKSLRLALTRMPFLSLREKIQVEKKLDRIAKLAVLSKKELSQIVGRPIESKIFPIENIEKRIERDLNIMEKYSMDVVFFDSPQYPLLLKEIYNPPYALFYRGDSSALFDNSLAVVGTRHPSGKGLKNAVSFSFDACKRGYSVVSGLALGIDAAAHKGAVDAFFECKKKSFGNKCGRTIAVLGSSPDMIFPATNRALAGKILQEGGCVLGEYPPETAPQKWHYPQRNRIISGLAKAVVVIEAPPASGALITVDFALEQNREVFFHSQALVYERMANKSVSPANRKKARYMRVSRYVEEGALVVENAEQVTDTLEGGNQKVLQPVLDFGE